MQTKKHVTQRWTAPQAKVTAEALYTQVYPGCDERAVMTLARCIHYATPDPGCSISWAAQEQAMTFHNAHGLPATLAECLRLDPTSLDAPTDPDDLCSECKVQAAGNVGNAPVGPLCDDCARDLFGDGADYYR